MSSIITIGSGEGKYQYNLTEMPKESDILYASLPKKQQFWRTPFDEKKQLDILDVREMTERDKIEYISMWRQRWLNGMWFFNNGVPTYITGAHVDHLIFNEFGGRKLRYLDAQRERFYFRELTNNDPLCDGRCWIKPRRAGLTTEQITEAIRILISDFNNNIIYQSDTQSKAISTLMKPTIDTYSRRVFWMRETYYAPNNKKPVKLLELKSNVIEKDGNYFLGGQIEALPSVASAADGKDAVLFVQDEFSKNESCSPYEMLEVNMRAVNPDKSLKIDALSTTGDTKDAQRATMDWHKLIANSNPQKRNPNGKTNSGLYKYFVNAVHSLLLLKEIPDVLDNNGFINKEMAEEWIWNEHKKYAEGTKEHIFSLYKFPLKEEHALLSSTLASNFNKIKIALRLKELRALMPHEYPFVRGVLEENSKGKVSFVSDAERLAEAKSQGYDTIIHGKWLWRAHPYFSSERNIDCRNRYQLINGVHFPHINIEGSMGYDPIDYPKNLTSSQHLSRASIFIRKKFDYYNKSDSTDYFTGVMALYLDRPDDPHDANKELIKAMKYTGFSCMHERSVSHVYEDCESAGMLPFLLKDDKGIYGLSPSDMKAKRDGLSMLQSRYSNPKTIEDTDEIMEYPFEDGLIDLENFDIGNTTPYDVTMSEIYCEHGLKQVVFTNVTNEKLNRMNDIIKEIIPPRKRVMA